MNNGDGKIQQKKKKKKKGKSNGDKSRIFSDLKNGDLLGCFEKFLQWLIICTVGEHTLAKSKSTTMKLWLISNQTLINNVFL
jgi:hypothetical protein